VTSKIYTIISKPLYDLIVEEKKQLVKLEKDKIRSRRKQVTMITASQSIMRKIR
jgi:hypothetical protein